MRAAKPDEMMSSISDGNGGPTVPTAITQQQQQNTWGMVGQNHLPPRGDITDLVKTGTTASKNDHTTTTTTTTTTGEIMDIEKTKQERLSNGFSSHDTNKQGLHVHGEEENREEEEEQMEITSGKEGAIINGGDRDRLNVAAMSGREIEGEGEGAEERGGEGGGVRYSQGSSDDELRQSVGSITSSEFNPNVFGAIHDEEMVQGGGLSEGEWLVSGGDGETEAELKVCLV